MRSVQVNVLLNNCKQNMMSLSLLAGRTVDHVSSINSEIQSPHGTPIHIGSDARKSVFRVSDKVGLKPVSTATETS